VKPNSPAVRAPTTPRRLDVGLIRIDGGTQSRAEIEGSVVQAYAEDIADGAIFPPVVVFHDGEVYWLADGFHRHKAHVQAGKKKVPVDVRQGTRRDAILYSVGANAEHGLRRSNDDKRRAVLTLLNDAEWAKW
jgi:ParB-like chromosome segregation protein Spo0J